MKILKNIFGSKPKQNTKYEPNTLAEINGSPDLRLATAKEKALDIPLTKTTEAKKTSKSTSNTSAQKKKITTKNSTPVKENASHSNGDVIETETKKVTKSTVKENNEPTIVNRNTTKKTQPAANPSKKEDGMKKEITKVSSTTKKTDVKTKTEAKKNTNKTAITPSSPTIKQVKKEVKTAVPKKENAQEKAPVTKQKYEIKKEANTVPAMKKSASSNNKKTTESGKVTAKKTTSTVTSTSKTLDNTKKTTKQEKNTDSEVITESKVIKSGKFEIKKSKDGRFVFNLYASNNLIVATSQVYSSSTSAMNGIKSVIANAASAPIEDQSLKNVKTVPYPKWEIYIDKGDEYRFRLCASNGSCVCHSQGYTTKANCKKGIESIIKFANDAEITKTYLEKK